jgi:predicted nuclease of restriction endonuclease-like (RecB) superfamily
MSKQNTLLSAEYTDWLATLKQCIAGARQRIALAADEEQIRLYHDIGREILERQNVQGWGAKVIDQLSADLRAAFHEMKGLSSSNLKYMRFFAQHCPDRQLVSNPLTNCRGFISSLY